MALAEPALRVRDLTKRYGRRAVLTSVSLEVARGETFGLLGPNGAGKTTLLRVAVGLAHADAGSTRLLGAPVPDRLAEVLQRVGASVGEMSWYGQLSGARNLRLLSLAAGRPLGWPAIDGLLATVGLDEARRKRTKRYSTGMRQRLGIASALAGDPELVMLDEPTAGLDPHGVRLVRDLVAGLRDRGVTVVLSSHQLSEVELICDAVAILDAGRLVASGPVPELLDRHATRAVIRAGDAAAGSQILAAAEIGFEIVDGGIAVAASDVDRALATLAASGAPTAGGAIPLRPTLEQLFFQLTQPARRGPT